MIDHFECKNIVSLSLLEHSGEDHQDNIMQMKHILSKCYNLSGLNLFDFRTENSQTIDWIIKDDDDVVLLRLVEFNLMNSVALALIIKLDHQLKKLFRLMHSHGN